MYKLAEVLLGNWFAYIRHGTKGIISKCECMYQIIAAWLVAIQYLSDISWNEQSFEKEWLKCKCGNIQWQISEQSEGGLLAFKPVLRTIIASNVGPSSVKCHRNKVKPVLYSHSCCFSMIIHDDKRDMTSILVVNVGEFPMRSPKI